MTQFPGGAVLLVRNPYHAILSYWDWEESGGRHTATAAPASRATQRFSQFVTTAAGRWEELVADWARWSRGPVTLVLYEELKQDPVRELRHLLAGLGLQLQKKRLACLLSDLTGSFHRKTNRSADNPFTAEHRRLLGGVVERVGGLVHSKTGRSLPRYTDRM